MSDTVTPDTPEKKPSGEGGKTGHYVNPAPFNPFSVDELTPEQERYYQASQWKIMWWKFRRHRLAVWAGIILILMYLMVPFAEVIAPYTTEHRDDDHIYAPPQGIHLFHEGSFVGPFVYGYEYELDMERMVHVYKADTTKVQPIRFFCSGQKYKFWNLFEASFHLICPAEGGTLFLLGTDRLGHDMLSGVIYGARISLTVGLVGISIGLILGLLLGGIAGYFGGLADAVIQRMIEILRSLPELPLWMALSAALPVTWSPVWIFFGITIILGLIDWPGLARAVRSKLLSLREEEYARAAVYMGANPSRVIRKHLLPGFTSHIIASATLSIPGMILGETALSFLNLGLRRPAVSWGVLLSEAQNITAVTVYPWLMAPIIPVIIVVLAYNFLGDGLRDAADPYK